MLVKWRKHWRQPIVLSLLAAAMWALLTANQGWGFFVPLCVALLIWQYANPSEIPVLRWRYLPAFLWFFLRQLVLGAFDVARRALFTGAGADHGWGAYSSRLQQAPNRQLLATLISLLPGTCSASVSAVPTKAQTPAPCWLIQLHLLDTRLNWQQDVAQLEWHLARLMADEAILPTELIS